MHTDDRPQRIASLLPGATEMLFGLGLGERVVAVSHECDFPEQAAHLPRVTVSHVDSSAASEAIDRQVRERLAAGEPLYGVDVDRLTSLRPDLIVTQAQCDVCAVRYDDVLAAVASRPELRETQVLAQAPESLDDVFADIAALATAAGCEQAGAACLAELRHRVAAVEAETAGRALCQLQEQGSGAWGRSEAKPPDRAAGGSLRSTPGTPNLDVDKGLSNDERTRVACIEWIEPLMLAGNWMPGLIHRAGGRQPAFVAAGHSRYTEWDAVVEFDPQVIVVMPCGFDRAQHARGRVARPAARLGEAGRRARWKGVRRRHRGALQPGRTAAGRQPRAARPLAAASGSFKGRVGFSWPGLHALATGRCGRAGSLRGNSSSPSAAG